ncbi:CcoQ/FixQ family Cbb3-type cytochrome c oxidase assembly chaperone [Arcticibacterium luteifluviistationis]|uniref:CcoQ/FixQ family Cbb3-type cytochrome c oxidase assembly chaperone n=1 Tax=Arcticibacterium luteifluviistationis TaxID=1784714 RepID=A0A2Z4GH46_9BACT|nr:CcoQ/FixQ family Cbb3-type cytochrome c oxidase assembly chaperone [Arcticibacterium luteifluviistationis]AWW00522.1 CcoQ/FixQ family Cbb3-type cytochrome c oxidase assembly chaperone [Arcticibacterium luteifluviistationis]
MIKNYLSDIEGVSIYPIISLSIFFIFFVLLGIFVFKSDKKYITYMENLPLGDSERKDSQA